MTERVNDNDNDDVRQARRTSRHEAVQEVRQNATERQKMRSV